MLRKVTQGLGLDSLARLRQRKMNRMDLREIGWEGVDRVHLAGPRKHGNGSSGSVKGEKLLD